MDSKGDFWVKHTQMWLNNTFGNNKNWVRLNENGYTGTNTMKGLIRGFQIHNGITPITGEVGPITIKKFKDLPIMKKMNSTDKPDINAFIVQGALFCKGYNAGGLTGIFYNSGVRATKELQSDAAITVTGEIGWKERAALLSMNWFTLVSGGDTNVRTIQRQLNSEFSNEIGVGPCDGIISRHTALSLIAALQAAEGIPVVEDLNQINFGDKTTERFPELKFNQNDEYHKKFNRILQYGLYFNGFNPGNFEGNFDTRTYSSVGEFQKKYGLLNIGLVSQGIVNASTMKSILTSKGDTSRRAYACDCATILNKNQAYDLKKAGFTHVGRYLTGTVGVGPDEKPKALSTDEIDIIKEVGLSLFPLYQDGGSYEKYFHNSDQGLFDASTAILVAKSLGLKANTTIYFAVDFDCFGYQIEKYIIPYFKNINLIFKSYRNNKNYKIGIYAPRYVCTKVSEQNLVSTSFVADMSTGFSGNLGYPIPNNWAFDQFNELTFKSSPSFPIDKDAYSGRDVGCDKFDNVPRKTIDDIKGEIDKARFNEARKQYIYKAVKSTGYLDKVVNMQLNFESKPMNLAYIITPTCTINLDLILSKKYKLLGSDNAKITIELDKNGQLTSGFKERIISITKELGEISGAKKVRDLMYGIALSTGDGDISFEAKLVSAKELKFKIEIANKHIPAGIKDYTEASIEFECTINITDSKKRFDDGTFSLYSYSQIAVIGVVLLIAPYISGSTVGIEILSDFLGLFKKLGLLI